MIELNLTAKYQNIKDFVQGKLPEAKRKLRQWAPFLIMGPALFGLAGCGEVKPFCEPGDTATECSHRQQLSQQEFERQYAIQKSTEQAVQDKENYEAYLTQEAEKNETKELQQQEQSKIVVGIVQEGQGILDVLRVMGIQVDNVVNPMQLTQRYSVKAAKGNLLATFTFKEILDGYADYLILQPGDCVGIYDPEKNAGFDPKNSQEENYSPLIDACSLGN